VIPLALDIYGFFKMIFDCLWVVVDVFEVVVDGCWVFRGGCGWFWVVLGGCRSFLLLVTTIECLCYEILLLSDRVE